MTEPPKFKFLDDSCSPEDLTEDKTHQRIADQLLDLIVSGHPGGMTIGLEGNWGSGKSTVVELLRQKLGKDDKTLFYYIDTWAHEGDPLRRAFLESLIEQIKTTKGLPDTALKQLDAISARITNRSTTRKATRHSRVEKYGRRMGIAALLVPLGAALVGEFASRVTLQWTGRICVEFWLGAVLSLAPLWVFLYYLVAKKDRHFLTAESTEEITSETSLEEERSSVEFARYFDEIIGAIKACFDKIVMVIDNLDRIDRKDALRVWSTLQTFVQRKNPRGEKGPSIAKWIVVPYARERLGWLWNRASEEKQEPLPSDKNSKPLALSRDEAPRALSFMDKSFDLRLRVPTMILGDWQAFAKRCIHEAAPGLSPADAETMLNVLNWSRDHLAEAPSPRQIKLYVNHVGVAWRLHGDHASLKAICFYVALKHLKGIPDDDIVREIVVGVMFHKALPGYALPRMEELAAIVYGVSEDKATRILLGEIIREGLKQSATDHLRHCRKTFGEDVFDTVACHVLGRAEFAEMPKFIASIQKAFPAHESKVCQDAFQRLQDNRFNGEAVFSNLSHEDALALLELSSQDSGLAKKLAEVYIKQLPLHFAESKSASAKSIPEPLKIRSGEEFIEKLRQVSIAARQEIKLPYVALEVEGFQFHLLEKSEMAELASFLVDPDEADAHLARHITSILLELWMVDWLSALIRRGMRRMDNVLQAIEQQLNMEHHIEGITIGDNQPHVARLLLALDLLPLHERPIEFIKKMLHSPVLGGLVDSSEPWLFYLLSKYRGEELAEDIASVGRPDSSLADYERAWTTSDGDLGEKVYKFSDPSGEYEWLAREAARPGRQLARDIILAALNADDKRLFDVSAPFKFLVDAWEWTDGKTHDALLNTFIANETRLEKLGEEGGESLTAFPEVCRALLEKCSEMSVGRLLFAKCIGELQRVAQEKWNEELENGPYVSFLVFLVQKGQAVNLGVGFYNAFKGLVADALDDGDSTNFRYEELLALYQAMDPTFRKLFASQIGRQLLQIQFNVAGGDFLRFLVKVPDYSDWLEEKPSEILDALVGFAQEDNLEPMANLAALLACHGERLSYWAKIKKTTKPFLDQMLQHADEEKRKWAQQIAQELEEGAKKARRTKGKKDKPNGEDEELGDGGER